MNPATVYHTLNFAESSMRANFSVWRTARLPDTQEEQSYFYAKAILKFMELNTEAQHRGAVVQGRSLLSYRLRYLQ
jgi:hypothetical protein